MWRRGVSTGRRLVFVWWQVVFRQNESFKSAPRFINMQYIHPQPAGSSGQGVWAVFKHYMMNEKNHRKYLLRDAAICFSSWSVGWRSVSPCLT